MKPRPKALSLVVLCALAVAGLAAEASGAMIGIYRNDMETVARRSDLVKLAGRDCKRGGSDSALRIVIGKRTGECSYSTPVVGRDLEIAATERLLSGTPRPLQHKAYLAVELRAGGGARYQLAVYPLQQKAQLRKIRADGSVRYLAIARQESAVKGLNMANALRLRAVNVTNGPERGSCRLRAFIGAKLVAEATDPAAEDLGGRASAVAVGSAGSANGVVASFDDVVVRVPSPF